MCQKLDESAAHISARSTNWPLISDAIDGEDNNYPWPDFHEAFKRSPPQPTQDVDATFAALDAGDAFTFVQNDDRTGARALTSCRYDVLSTLR